MSSFNNECMQPLERAVPRYLDVEKQKKSTLTEILTERGSRYGKFKSQAELTQKLKNVLHDNMGQLSSSQKEAIDMILHKLGRIANGDPNYIDSWTDIAGYAQLIADELNGIIR